MSITGEDWFSTVQLWKSTVLYARRRSVTSTAYTVLLCRLPDTDSTEKRLGLS